MRLIDKAIAIIKEFEGFRADAYPDPRTGGEPWTIGYGTTWYKNGTKVKQGDRISEYEANLHLVAKVTDLHAQLKREIKVPLTDGQWACMISFAYNMGLAGSLLQVVRLNVGRIPEFMVKHIEYINKGSNVEAGLRRRRIAELKLFNEGEPVAKVTWINLVRHTVKEAPEYRAYLMEGSICIEVKRFKTKGELSAILQSVDLADTNVSIGQEGWHVEPATRIPSGVATLKRTGKKRANGLEILALEFDGERFECVSGQPNAQFFRKPGDPRSVPGCMEPIPFGKYGIGMIEWAGGKDNYNASWGPGLGPVWIALPATFADDRSAFGIHLDSNASTSPGSAGCVVIPNESELKRLVAALRKHDPKTLEVLW